MSQFTFRTSPPPTYISPSGEEMREAAKKVDLKGFSRDLVADLCNLAGGGALNAPSIYRSQVQKKEEEKLPAPSSNGIWSIKKLVDGKMKSMSTTSRAEAIAAKTDQAMRYHQNVCDFLQATDYSKYPGGTPLEKSMSFLKMLSKQSGGSGGGEGGEPLPIFQENDAAESVAESMHDVLDMVDSLSEDEQDMLDPDGENQDSETESDGQKSGHKNLNRLKVAEDLIDGSNKRVMLDISRTLDQFSKLQVRKKRMVEPDPAGDETRTRPIRHLGELSKVAKSAWAMRQQNKAYFNYQAITGQLSVRERVTRNEKKQAILILVDGSGSMSGKKHWKATGVVMNRLKAVISGDAEVGISVFDTSADKIEWAKTPEEAKKLVKRFGQKNFSGGGTDIAAAVKAGHQAIEERLKAGEALYRPEVVVLTDEDTSINGLKRLQIPGTRVHGFAMEVSNPSLVKFAQSTGGVGIDNF